MPRAELQEVYEQTTAATVRPVPGSDGTLYRLQLRFRTAAQASRKMSFSKAKTYKNSTQFNMGPWPTKEDALKMAVKFRNTVEFGKLTAPPANKTRRTASAEERAKSEREQQERKERAAARTAQLKKVAATSHSVSKAEKMVTERLGYIAVLGKALETGKVFTLIQPESVAGEVPVVGEGEETKATQTQKFRVENIARGLKHYYEELNDKFERQKQAKEEICTAFHDVELAAFAAKPHRRRRAAG